MRDLLAVRRNLELHWESLVGLGVHMMYTDVIDNSVRFTSLWGANDSALQQYLAPTFGSAPISFAYGDSTTLITKPAPASNCLQLYRRCNPVRGGMFLQLQGQNEFNDLTECTMGYYAESRTTSSRYVPTAGHFDDVSFYHSGDFLGGFSLEAQSGQEPRSSDSQRQLLNDSWARSSFLIHRSSNGAYDQDYRITRTYTGSAVSAAIGSFLGVAAPQAAQVDQSLGAQCGQVLANEAMAASFDQDGNFMFTVDPAYAFQSTVVPGDSGGPNYASNRAYGLTSGMATVQSDDLPSAVRDLYPPGSVIPLVVGSYVAAPRMPYK